MTKFKRHTKALLKTIADNPRRSSLFRWMVAEHDKIVASAKGEKMDWKSFCAGAARRGLMDTQGRPVSQRNARETWMQARKHVAATRVAEANKSSGPIHPSRMAKDWQPPGAPAPAPMPQARPQQDYMPIRKTGPQELKPYDPEEQLARLQRVLAERSGR